MSNLKIPAPRRPDEEGWVYIPIVRIGRTIPFGYRQDPEDPDVLLPIESELKLFEQAKEHLKRYSYRDVAAWLSEESGRYISHQGLVDRIKSEQKRRRTGTIQRQLIQRLKEAIKKAERIEARYLGQKSISESETSSTGHGKGSGEAGTGSKE